MDAPKREHHSFERECHHVVGKNKSSDITLTEAVKLYYHVSPAPLTCTPWVSEQFLSQSFHALHGDNILYGRECVKIVLHHEM